jgi:hypothetical protein
VEYLYAHIIPFETLQNIRPRARMRSGKILLRGEQKDIFGELLAYVAKISHTSKTKSEIAKSSASVTKGTADCSPFICAKLASSQS